MTAPSRPSGDRPATDVGGVDGVCLEGVVERIVYENSDTGFLVGRLRAPEGPPEGIPFVGTMLAVSPGETVRLWGR